MPAALDEAEEQSVLDICTVKGLRLPETFLIELDLLLRQGYQLSFLVFAHDVEYSHNDVITNTPVAIQSDQLAFLIAEDAISVSNADDFDKPLIVRSDAHSLLQTVQIIHERRDLRMFPRLHHQDADLFLFHIP